MSEGELWGGKEGGTGEICQTGSRVGELVLQDHYFTCKGIMGERKYIREWNRVGSGVIRKASDDSPLNSISQSKIGSVIAAREIVKDTGGRTKKVRGIRAEILCEVLKVTHEVLFKTSILG